MPTINAVLIDALMRKMGVQRARVYARIAKVASDNFLERDAAALVLAKEVGLNTTKFSTREQRSAIRATPQSHTKIDDFRPAMPPAPSSGKARAMPVRKAKPGDAKSIFVVNGRDNELRTEVFTFLRALNLHPFEWGTALKEAQRGANPNVETIIDVCMAKVQAVVVLFSPDEEVVLTERLRNKRDSPNAELQPRPNVIFEAGLGLGRHPEKTLLIEVGPIRGFSDIAGRHMARLTNDLASRSDIINRLKILKCDVELSGTDWQTAGDFPND